MPGWAVAVLAVVLGPGTLALAVVVLDTRLLNWYRRRGGDRVWRTIGWVVLTHGAFLPIWLLVAGAAGVITDATGSQTSAGWVVVPMIALHAPFLWCAMPTMYTGFRPHRDEAKEAGMREETTRAVYWTGAPFAMLGLCICLAAFYVTFLE